MSDPITSWDVQDSAGEPLVSILVPAWECRAYIGEAIRSALGQTYPNVEVVVVEDCGADGTYEEACRFREPRLRVYRNDRNLGQYANKNRALAHARGLLLKYLDGDDVLQADAVSILVDVWRRAGPGTGVVFASFSVIDALGRFVGRPMRWGLEGRQSGHAILERALRLRLAASFFGNVTPHLIERAVLEAVGGFPNDNAGPGDLETFCKLLAVSDVAFTERETALYRVHASSMSRRTFGARECEDYVRMVDRLEHWFAGRSGLPEFLQRPVFYREWRVWAGAHNIFASLQRRLRGKPNQYREIAAMYLARGLEEEFHSFVAARWPDYLFRTMATKFRRRLGLPDGPPLFR